MTNQNRRILYGSLLLWMLIVVSYFLLDRPVTQACRELNPSLLQLFQWVTELGISTGYLILLFVLFLIFRYALHRRTAANRALFLFAAVALSGLATNLIKPLIGRLRPKLMVEAGLYGFEPFRIGYEYNSFPSGHATTVFALAAGLSLFFPRWRLPFLGIATLVALSRIIVGSHYLSDVMAGAYVGFMTVSFLVLLCRRRGWPLHARNEAQGDRHA